VRRPWVDYCMGLCCRQIVRSRMCRASVAQSLVVTASVFHLWDRGFDSRFGLIWHLCEKSPSTLFRKSWVWQGGLGLVPMGLFIWEAGRDVCRDGTMNGIPQAGSRFVQPGSRLNRDVFFHANTCCRNGMEGGMILVYWNKWPGLNERSNTG
jgi:hypothetical protein